MSYDINLKDPITNEVIEFDEPHQMKGGMYAVGGTREAWLNITYTRKGKTVKRMKDEHHGQWGTRLYRVWANMKARCNCPSRPEYKNYGGRGIRMCEEWQKFGAFYEWAMNNGYDPDAPFGKCTIDRIDNNGDYCPENCRWTDMHSQDMNKRPYKKPARRKPVDMIAEDGSILKTFESIQDAAEYSGCYHAAIVNVCRGRNKKTRGIRWQYSTK